MISYKIINQLQIVEHNFLIYLSIIQLHIELETEIFFKWKHFNYITQQEIFLCCTISTWF